MPAPVLAALLAVAEDAFPGHKARFDSEGQLNTALRVGAETIVRFPKHAFGVERLAFEVALLAQVGPHLTIDVPEIIRVALDRPVGEAFVAHRAIPGDALRSDQLAALSPPRVYAIASQVAAFLSEFHGLADQARAAGTPELTPRGLAAALTREVGELLASRVTPQAETRARRELARLADLPDAPAVLCHTDIGGNIIVNADADKVGVIDFAGSLITHPALDVASLSVLGDRFLADCAAHYPLLGDLTDLAGAVRGTFALQDALYGARQHDWPYVDRILRGYS